MIHFYFELPNVADWLALALTFIGLCLAFYALNQWKKEKEWDVIIESISYAPVALEYIEYLYSVQSDTMIFNEKTFEETQDLQTKKLTRMTIRKQRRFDKSEDHIRLLYSKLEFLFKENHNIVKEFYFIVLKKIVEYSDSERNIFVYEAGIAAHEKHSQDDSKDVISMLEKKISENRQKILQIPEDHLDELREMLNRVQNYNIKKQKKPLISQGL